MGVNQTADPIGAVIHSALSEAADVLEQLRANTAAIDSIAAAATVLGDAFRNGNRAFACGNGGSMCDAMHFAEELSGRFRDEKQALPAQAISDPGHLSCVANDYGYDSVFARYIQAHGRPGDVLLAISTSGNSENVVLAAHQAKTAGLKVIGLTGKPKSALTDVADVSVVTPGGVYADRVQELHIKVIHILIESVELLMYGKK